MLCSLVDITFVLLFPSVTTFYRCYSSCEHRRCACIKLESLLLFLLIGESTFVMSSREKRVHKRNHSEDNVMRCVDIINESITNDINNSTLQDVVVNNDHTNNTPPLVSTVTKENKAAFPDINIATPTASKKHNKQTRNNKQNKRHIILMLLLSVFLMMICFLSKTM